jgi:hypothetical protein
MAGVRAKLIGHSTGRYRLTFAGEVTNDGQVSAQRPRGRRRRRRRRVRACTARSRHTRRSQLPPLRLSLPPPPTWAMHEICGGATHPVASMPITH